MSAAPPAARTPRSRRRRRGRVLRWTAAGLALVLLALALGVLVPSRPAASALPAGAAAPAEGVNRVLVLRSAIHTDIALPATPRVLARLGFLREAGLPLDDPRVAYVLVGRGGRSFYLETPAWSDLRPMPLLRSFGLDAAVLRFALAGAIDPEAEGARVLHLGDPQIDAILDFALAGLAAGPDGAPAAVAATPAYGPLTRFFEAKGRFNALVGCNVWTAEALNAAGLATGIWTPLPALLLLSLDLHAPGASLAARPVEAAGPRA